VTREKTPLHGAAEIGKAVGAVLGKRKMAKHFQLSITDHAFSFTRNAEAIADEAQFDGFLVLRTSHPAAQADAPPRRCGPPKVFFRWNEPFAL